MHFGSEGNGDLPLWSVATRQEVGTLKGHQKDVNSVSFSPDGNLLASGSDDETIKLWSVATRQEVGTLVKHNYREFDSVWRFITSVSFSPDSSLLASGSWDGDITLWSVATRQEISTLKGHKDGGIVEVSFSPDGELLASCASSDEAIKFWSVATLRGLGTRKHN